MTSAATLRTQEEEREVMCRPDGQMKDSILFSEF